MIYSTFLQTFTRLQGFASKILQNYTRETQ